MGTHRKLPPALCWAFLCAPLVASCSGSTPAEEPRWAYRPHRGPADLARSPAVLDHESASFHKPGLDEYGLRYKGDPDYPLFSLWYSGFLRDERGREHMMRVSVFAPYSRYYPGAEVELNPVDRTAENPAVQAPALVARWPYEAVRVEEGPEQVVFVVEGEEGFEIRITERSHQLAVRTGGWDAELELVGMDPVFFYNWGNPAPMPNTRRLLWGFEDFMSGTGSLRVGQEESARMEAELVNERTFYDRDKWGWYDEDWLAVVNDEIYALLFQVTMHNRRLPLLDHSHLPESYIDGFVYLRESDDFIPLDDLVVEHLAYDPRVLDSQHGRIPTRILAHGSGEDLRVHLDLELVARTGMELMLRGGGHYERAGARHELENLRAWDEFMRYAPQPRDPSLILLPEAALDPGRGLEP